MASPGGSVTNLDKLYEQVRREAGFWERPSEGNKVDARNRLWEDDEHGLSGVTVSDSIVDLAFCHSPLLSNALDFLSVFQKLSPCQILW